MKKSVLNWIGQAVAVVAIGAAAATTAVAQSSGGLSVDEQFARELKLVESLKVYNDQLQEQLQAQTVAKREILQSIDKAKDLDPQMAPVLSKMLAALEAFVKADLPFHKEERMKSIFALKDLMTNPDATTSSRYRSIMDIYNVELEYGTTSEAYKATQPFGGNEIEVDMLRIGRVALYYQTTDQKSSGMWDAVNKEWKPLPTSANRDIRKAIKVAAKTTAPELLSLPISAPEGA
ncbi:DUF3450 domain-containing protein [Arenicella chitinivorans]|uniref:DUF3450 domain-containing protein n=1 Tax=Arenicella chitinivorans TaxID=1329800 RepID=A0A918VP99_9GAMM|nr:DUF3450 domain-containing protein [Arenicella chitinivorans]GHA12315.1 DUF3450 domain-containing protein [Arenicella chitinivorans]